MDRKTVAMAAGAAAALISGPMAASAAPTEPVPAASSYADLLQPIPNAVERLRLADMQDAAAAPQLIQAQYDHHHHHHHHHNRRWYITHGYYWFHGAWVLRPPPHHHHHHHHNY